MKLKHMLFTIAAAAILVEGAPTLQAQAPPAQPQAVHGTTPAYYVAEFELLDPEGMKPYRDQVDATFKPYSGRYIVRAGRMDRLEGEPPTHRLIVIEFDSLEQARAWYNSAEYAKVRPFRQRSGRTNAYIVEGLPK